MRSVPFSRLTVAVSTLALVFGSVTTARTADSQKDIDVVPGTVMAADVVKLSNAKTVQGQSVTIDTRGGVKVNNANVVKTDIVATNGVIHVIDAVILPR